MMTMNSGWSPTSSTQHHGAGVDSPIVRESLLSPSRTVVTSFHPRQSAYTVPGGPPSSTVPPQSYDDGDWVLQLAAGKTSVACAVSSGHIQVYDRERLHNIASWTCSDVPTDLVYANSSRNTAANATSTTTASPNTVVATAIDGSVVVYDVRCPTPVLKASIRIAPSSTEVATSLALGYDGTLVAVASDKARVHFLDVRQTGTTLGQYVDSHTMEVTQVAFSPSQPSVLLTGGEDGLVCCFDTTQSTEELALQSVVNCEAPVRRLGFCGNQARANNGSPSLSLLYCLTGNETASVWNFASGERVFQFDTTLRDALQQDYLVDCHWTGTHLLLCAGNVSGDAAIYALNARASPRTTSAHSSTTGSWQCLHRLSGGHRGVIRAWCPSNTSNVMLTVGEDARLCEWNRCGGTTVGASFPQASIQRTKKRRVTGGSLRRQRSKLSTSPY